MYAGIDVGSLVTKAVILRDGEIASYSILDSGSDPEEAGRRALQVALGRAGLKREEISFIVATGYGRVALPFANRSVTEMTCHGKGAHHLCRTVKTVVDIGGQDSKVMRLDEGGNMIDFMMNDKCAAGTGRFLEVMARALEVELEELGEFSLRSNNLLRLSSTCTVFAETEVISLLAARQRKEDIAAGLNAAIARRVGNMVKSFGLERDVVFVGGVAKNTGVKKALEEFLQVDFSHLREDPQIVGALGAALLAQEFCKKG